MIWFWVINIVFWVLFAFYNHAFIYPKQSRLRFHFWGGIVSVAFLVSIGLLSIIDLHCNDLWDVLALVVIGLSIRWNVFDPVFNLIGSNGAFTIGTTAFLDGGYDGKSKILRFMSTKCRRFQFVLKAIAIIISIFLSL